MGGRMILTYRYDIYRVKETSKMVFLIYRFAYPDAEYSDVVGILSGWRKDMFLRALPKFKAHREETDHVPALKMVLYMKLLPVIDDQLKAEKLIKVLSNMSFEELSFWNRKFVFDEKNAIRGFKAMYVNRWEK